MPNNDGTANVFDALKHIGVAAIGAVVIYLSSVLWSGLLFIIPPVVCGIAGWFAVSKDSLEKTKRTSALWWAAIGLAAGIGFFIAL